ncbi:luc7-like protein 3 [Centruroides vittatus]|uniref:luc7-like protein 3 n=1 Tax=Centruroides vittatus TaxID=120091 RepID=UPI00350F79D4
MEKQHVGYARLKSAGEEIVHKREREQEERKQQEKKKHRQNYHSRSDDRKCDVRRSRRSRSKKHKSRSRDRCYYNRGGYYREREKMKERSKYKYRSRCTDQRRLTSTLDHVIQDIKDSLEESPEIRAMTKENIKLIKKLQANNMKAEVRSTNEVFDRSDEDIGDDVSCQDG